MLRTGAAPAGTVNSESRCRVNRLFTDDGFLHWRPDRQLPYRATRTKSKWLFLHLFLFSRDGNIVEPDFAGNELLRCRASCKREL